MLVRWLALTVAPVCVISLFGCGGGGSETTSRPLTPDQLIKHAPSHPLNKRQFIARADAICRRADRLASPPPRATGMSPRQIASLSASQRNELADGLRQNARDSLALVAALRALQPPPGDQRTIGSYLGFEARLAHAIARFGEAVASGDLPRVRRLNNDPRLNDWVVGAAEIGHRYGFRFCRNED